MPRITRIAAALLAAVPFSWAQAQPPPGESKPLYQVMAPDLIPVQVPKPALLNNPAVQDELKLSDAQKTRFPQIRQQFNQKLREAFGQREESQRETAVDRLRKELDEAMEGALEPSQRKRLDQLHLRVEGPVAFLRPEVSRRLRLSESQVKEIQTISDAGREEIQKACTVPVDVKGGDSRATLDAIRKVVERPEFQGAKQNALRSAFAARDAVLERIRKVLNDDQRATYDTMLGAPFDLAKLQPPDGSPERDVAMIARGLGLFGQRADSDFNTKVAHPAYTTVHPRVVIDEAHHNFHTASGRYKPLADLLSSDGYRALPGKEKFTKEALERCDVLVIANALGAQSMGDTAAANSAFTPEECDAVRDWVKAGGSLLLITDHAPMGAAASDLAKRFGVDMSQGVTLDPSHSADGPASLVFSRENQLLGDHPITVGRNASERINRVQTFAGQSLKGPPESVAFLKLADTALDRTPGEQKEVSAAGRCQGLALTFGKGRVVVLGEAAQLSAQVAGPARVPMGMNVPGIDNRQMALNILHWLSRLE